MPFSGVKKGLLVWGDHHYTVWCRWRQW